MHIFPNRVAELFYGWNALVAQCNRKRRVRSITFPNLKVFVTINTFQFGLDIKASLLIMAAFYAPSLYDARPLYDSRATSHILRQISRRGEGYPQHTRNKLQEIT